MDTTTTKKMEPNFVGHGIRADGTQVLLHAEGPGLKMWFLRQIANRNLKRWNAERRHLLDGSPSN